MSKKTYRQWEKKFLDALADTCNVSAAAKAAGIRRSTAYEFRKNNPDFAAKWDEALEKATDELEAEARTRALGFEEPVFNSEGEEVGTVRRYSDTLMIFLLKAYRPKRFREPRRRR